MYCDIDDLKQAIPEADLIRLTDDAGSGSIDTDKTDAAIEYADLLIDAYIGNRVSLPIAANTPPILTSMAVDLAIYNLYTRTGIDPPKSWIDRQANAIKLLEKINDGKISLGIQPAPDAPADETYSSRIRTNTRTREYDSDKLDQY